jgi:hypothetical protein
MKSLRYHLPLLVIVGLCGAALWHGPIAQIPDYHNFSDQLEIAGIPHFADVLSNMGFALVAMWGLLCLTPAKEINGIRYGWAGYRLFLIGLFFTAIGSSYYHLEPDNAHLVWDRLPIALACSGLLAGVWGEVHGKNSATFALWLALVAVLSVAWWYFTEQSGAGDLRPYLILQGLPIILVPLWQWIYDMRCVDRRAFGGALLIYVIAKFAELNDHEIAAAFGMLTGHTLKHLLATGAAALIVARLICRTHEPRQIVITRPATNSPAATDNAISVLK